MGGSVPPKADPQLAALGNVLPYQYQDDVVAQVTDAAMLNHKSPPKMVNRPLKPP